MSWSSHPMNNRFSVPRLIQFNLIQYILRQVNSQEQPFTSNQNHNNRTAIG